MTRPVANKNIALQQVQYTQSKACKMSHVRDLPPVSGSIIWAKQIDRQLSAYMRRVEDVLGKGKSFLISYSLVLFFFFLF